MRRVAAVWVLASFAAACSIAAPAPEPPASAVPLPSRVAGANVRPVGDRRRGYGTRKARETLSRLHGMGVNTISVLMEGRMNDVEDTEVRPPSGRELDDLQAILRDANRMGFATILIPHLYLDDREWRGRITRGSEEWWRSYEAFILGAADISSAHGVTVLSIGVELKGLSARAETRAHMAELRDTVRARFRGMITYSANWDEAEQVGFWDLTDVAGVNGYYPLVPDPERGAEAIARRLARLGTLAGREVIVLEAGFRAGPLSHVRPWEWPEDVRNAAVDEGAQARAWAAVLGNWLDARHVRGVCVWVIPTDPDDPASEPVHGFNPLNRAAEEVIRRAFATFAG